VTFCSDGGYLGSPFAVEMNGTSSRIDCGTGATLDDLGAGGAIFQAECYFRHDTATAGTYVLLSKGWAALTGWSLYINSSGYLTGVVDLVTTDSTPSLATSVRDGKWHHGVLSYNDTTKNGYTALDGVWSAASLGNGNYVADNALSLYMGRRSDSAVSYMLGAMGWSRIHNHAHYTPGTNFVPPRVNPGSDAGTVERWDADEGTLAVLNAHVTTPANDGAMTNCTWSAVWAPQATPIVPTSLQFDGAVTAANCGNDVSIQNLHDAEITIDGYFQEPVGGTGGLIMKGSLAGARGWAV
jgi:hypothetical protein